MPSWLIALSHQHKFAIADKPYSGSEMQIDGIRAAIRMINLQRTSADSNIEVDNL